MTMNIVPKDKTESQTQARTAFFIDIEEASVIEYTASALYLP